MEFKYKTRMGKTWDNSYLSRFLKLNYPGAKSLIDALQMEKEARAQKAQSVQPDPSSAELRPSQPNRLPYKESDEIIDF